MERLKAKMAQAAGIGKRLAEETEKDVDALIAREDELRQRKNRAFVAHNTALDTQKRDLDQFEDALQILDNGAPPPLPDTGTTEPTEAAAKPADQFQPTH